MKNTTKKKSLLAVATALMPTSVTMLVRGSYIEGGILMAFAIAMILLYDHYDDKMKMPEGMDPKMFEEFAKLGAEGIKGIAEKYKNSEDN